MTTLEDKLDDEEVEAVEEAKIEDRRSKTKYGGLIEGGESGDND